MTEFEGIYRAYFSDVFHYIRRLSGDEQLAEEITSETFFRAMRSIHRFRGDCDIRVWLCQIAKNCYFSYRKREKRTGRVENIEHLDVPAQEDTVEEQLIRRDDAAQLQKLLHGMPEPYREVFMWRVFAELSFRQIAQIFGKTENWACVTYHRARKMILKQSEVAGHEK